MTYPAHTDLLIVDDDVVLEAGYGVSLVDQRASIAQDIIHSISESGLLTALIGERDREKRTAIMVQIVSAIEEDTRIIPGTAQMTPKTSDGESYWLTANTYDYNSVGFWL